jgi:hypothetical protein
LNEEWGMESSEPGYFGFAQYRFSQDFIDYQDVFWGGTQITRVFADFFVVLRVIIF